MGRGRSIVVACLTLLLLGAVGAVAGVGGAGAAPHRVVRPAPAPPRLDSAQVQGTIRAHSRRQARLRSRAEKHKRLRSRTAFRRASALEALAIGRDHFHGVFASPAFHGLDLRPGEHIHEYTSDHSALVDHPGGKRGLAESTLPLLTKDRSGHEARVDLALESRDGALEPVNPLVQARFGGAAGDGFSLPDVGVKVRVSGADDSDAQPTDDKAFYANAMTDTDFLDRPTPRGVETYAVLRSAASPEAITYAMSLPAGAELELLPGGNGFPAGAAVTRGGHHLLEIPPPIAYDADGQPVPVAYRVSGSDLTVSVSHRGTDVHYPIMLDPGFNVADQFANTAGWGWLAVGGPYFHGDGSYNYGSPVPAYGTRWGMLVEAPAGTYQLNSYGNMWWSAQPNSYIYRGEFQYVTYGWVYQAVNQGLWVPSRGQWDVLRQTGTNLDNNYYTACSAGPNPLCDPGNGSNDNAFVLGLQNIYLTNANYTYASAATMQSALIYQRDRFAPAVTGLSQSSSGWVDTKTLSTTASGSDTGLGMKEFAWIQPDRSQTTSTHGCAGTRTDRCPASWSATYSYNSGSLPEGSSTFAVAARDIVSNGSPETPWTVKVDHSKPTVPSLSGSLWTHRNQTADHRDEGLYDPSYTLNASAGDALSGLKSIDVQVDSGTPTHYPASCSGTDGCSDSIPTWTFNSDSYAEGDHTITVTAKDQLADQAGVDNTRHVSTQSFQVTVDRRGDIYHGVDWEGDPATADTTGEEFAQLNTQNMRHLTENTLVTRTVLTCITDTWGCAQEHSETRNAQTNPGTPDDYTVTNATSHDDPRMRDDSELLAPANSSLGTPTAVGPIDDALQLWQRPPPAHGTTYSLYTTTTQTVTDENAEDEVTKLWLDSGTKMPLHKQTSSGGTVESDVYYVYDRSRLHGTEVPGDFFSASAPANVGQTSTIALPVTDLPTLPEPSPPTDDQQIADAQALRVDLGLRNDYTYVKGLFDDVTLDNAADSYGIPLTSAERADLDARVSAEQDLSVVDDWGASQGQAAFAGTYVDQQNGGAIYVGFTNNVTANMNAVKAIYPHPELLHPFPTTPARTLQQLDALETQVESDWDSGALSALNVNSVGRDEQTNQVVLTSPSPTAADQAFLTARYGSGVTIEQRDISLGDSAANHRTPPNIGGLEIVSNQGGGGVACTSGFGAVKYYNTGGHKGREYFDVTAGHCLASTDQPGSNSRGYGLHWYHNGKGFGIEINDTLVPAGKKVGSDAMSVQVAPGTQSNRIYVRTGKDAKPHLVRITGSVDHFHRNQLVCHSGYRTRREFCGRVTRPNMSDHETKNGTKVVHEVEVKMSSCGVDEGDSGGPAFHKHKAFGVVRLLEATRAANCSGTRGNFFTFTPIGYSVSDLGGLELLR